MKDIYHSWQPLGRIVVVIVANLLLVAPLMGQTTDLQIMVSGPWDYVVDPHDTQRLVLIAPISTVHDAAELFPGDDATKFKGQRRLEPGIFKLDIGNRAYISKASSSNPYRLQETANIPVDVKTVIEPAIYRLSMSRYAVSLPKPDYYTTYVGSYGNGTSQSIISTQTIINSGGATDYTTWMVLHYAVTSVAPAKLTGTSDDGSVTHSDDIPFVSSSVGGTTLGISIVTMAKDNFSYWMCDSYSHDSFNQKKMLWGGLALHSLFPSVDLMGHQKPGDFHYNCAQILTQRFLNARDNYRSTLDEVQQIREYLENLAEGERNQALKNVATVRDALKALFNEDLPKDIEDDFTIVNKQLDTPPSGRNPRATSPRAEEALTQIAKAVYGFTAGGGDCHTAQFSINQVVP
jgi:hypothetical protein